LVGLPDHLLRTSDDSDVSKRIDHVCDQFELLCKSGSIQPRLEFALANLAVEHRAQALPLLVEVELEFRPTLLPAINASELHQRFPLYFTQPPDLQATGSACVATQAQTPLPRSAIPATIGEFKVISRLGSGGFGTVYLAEDPNTKQRVAIKVARRDSVQHGDRIQAWLEEARIAARLDHPRIVPVLYCGQSQDIPFHIVMKFIEGSTLAERLQKEKLSFCESADLIAKMADALHHAHTRRIRAHRDVKPGNILLDKKNQPYLTDFGLALPEQSYGSGPAYCGTLEYMSPEQARGEGHLVDELSDIFSLGIVFHELLTGRRPFTGREQELQESIASASVLVQPLRLLDDRIPAELERICLKMLAKHPYERYHHAINLEQDLNEFLASFSAGKTLTNATYSGSPRTAIQTGVIPQQGIQTPSDVGRSFDQPASVELPGLRSFDAEKSEYFIQLLPGPRDRSNFPESVSWWKKCVEERDASRTFKVGVLYGPSGCGKSSLIRAGIMPRLDASVVRCYVSANPDSTTEDLLAAIRSACDPELPTMPLSETLQGIGGAAGVGRAFLEETITSRNSLTKYSRHKHATAEILKRLIEPDDKRSTTQSGMKGSPRSRTEQKTWRGMLTVLLTLTTSSKFWKVTCG
jgi:serine/threonine protein kinase